MESKTLLLVTLLLAFTGLASSQVTHRIDLNEENAYVNTTIVLKSETGENYWQTTWSVPEDAENLEIMDTGGSIRPVFVDSNTVQFNTSKGEIRNEEVVKLSFTIPGAVENVRENLSFASFQLPGFRGEETSIQVEAPQKILGTKETYGFVSSFKNRTANFSGDGATNIKVSWTPKNGSYDKFILFGDANLSRADKAYPLLNLLTGRKTGFRKFAVVITPDSVYNQKYDSWFAGTYESAGLIFIRASEVEKNTFTGLLLHEVMHGFNQRPLKWVRTNSSVFDEGTAKYAEFLVNNNLNVKQPEIFGENVEWEAPCEERTKTCRYTLNPRGNPDELWRYYERNLSFMERWNPAIGKMFSEDLSIRTFGYSYGELIIREYLEESNINTLKPVYQNFKSLEVAEGYEEYFRNLRAALDSDLKPCFPNSRSEFENCLNRLNSMDPELPEEVEVEGENYNITFQPVEKRERKERNLSELIEPRRDTRRSFWEWLLSALKDWFSNVL